MWTKKGGLVTGIKEAEHEEHMANTDQDRAMCSNTKQTQNHETTTKQTRLPGQTLTESTPFHETVPIISRK